MAKKKQIVFDIVPVRVPLDIVEIYRRVAKTYGIDIETLMSAVVALKFQLDKK